MNNQPLQVFENTEIVGSDEICIRKVIEKTIMEGLPANRYTQYIVLNKRDLPLLINTINKKFGTKLKVSNE